MKKTMLVVILISLFALCLALSSCGGEEATATSFVTTAETAPLETAADTTLI